MFFAFSFAVLAQKTPVFLPPLKNNPQQKWCVFKSEIVTAIVFIKYQYLAN